MVQMQQKVTNLIAPGVRALLRCDGFDVQRCRRSGKRVVMTRAKTVRSRRRPWPILAMAWMIGALAAADPLPQDPLQRQCWLQHTAERTEVDLREPTLVSFSNLKSGMTVRSPFWVEFGIRGMGVIPAGNARERAGHHHLLVDAPLPIQHDAKIPFSDTHRHFGKAQTGTTLDLPPGRHTLRLLFADHEHRPYFVYSPEIVVNVSGRRVAQPGMTIDAEHFEATCHAWYEDQVSTPRTATKEVYVKNLRDGESVTSPFELSFGVIGLGVAPAGTTIEDTGHFVLRVTRGGVPVSSIDLADGRTETLLDLPRGEYVLELIFADAEGTPLLKGEPLRVPVMTRNPL
jgi:hypothetical protein